MHYSGTLDSRSSTPSRPKTQWLPSGTPVRAFGIGERPGILEGRFGVLEGRSGDLERCSGVLEGRSGVLEGRSGVLEEAPAP